MSALRGGDEAAGFYRSGYQQVHRSGIQGWGNSFVDRQVERYVRPEGGRTLELGASSGEHLAYVDGVDRWDVYVGVDLMPGETSPDLARELMASGRMAFVGGDVSALPFRDSAFDLVRSTCLLAHVSDPETALGEVRRVTRPGGQIVLGLPCDPGMLNRLVKVAVTYPQMRRSGVADPRLKYAREHVNPVGSLLAMANHVFRDDTLEAHYYPARLPSWNANLLVTLDITRA